MFHSELLVAKGGLFYVQSQDHWCTLDVALFREPWDPRVFILSNLFAPGTCSLQIRLKGWNDCQAQMLIVETVLWRRLQAQPLNAADRYKGMREVFSRTFQAEGIRGFYKGLLPNMLKVVPSASITYLVYEEMKTRLSLKWRFTWANRPFDTSITWLLHRHSSIQEMADVNCCISITANHWYVLRCAKEEPDIAFSCCINMGGTWVRIPKASCAFRLNEFYLESCSCTVIGSLDVHKSQVPASWFFS